MKIEHIQEDLENDWEDTERYYGYRVIEMKRAFEDTVNSLSRVRGNLDDFFLFCQIGVHLGNIFNSQVRKTLCYILWHTEHYGDINFNATIPTEKVGSFTVNREIHHLIEWLVDRMLIQN